MISVPFLVEVSRPALLASLEMIDYVISTKRSAWRDLSYLKENLMLVKEIENEPTDGYVARVHNH